MAVLFERIRYLITLHEQRFLSVMAFSNCEVIRVATNCTHARETTSQMLKAIVSFEADTEGKT